LAKKSPFNIFGRRSSSRSRPPKLMQLPDIAVAAKTLNGSRHIAISIPIQYDHPEDTPAAQRTVHGPTSPASKFPPPVTVLKPVVEAREPVSPYRKPSLEGKREGGSPDSVPAAELLGPETAKTLKNYYTQLHRQHKLSAESNSSLKSGERSQRNSQTGTYTDAIRADNAQSDPRHSGGTVYSAVAISLQDHSQRLSSTSTSPSVNIISVKSDMPRQNSSGPRVPKAIQTELAQNYQASNFPSQQEPPRSSVLPDRTESLTSETSAYSFPAVAAEVTRGYNNAAVTQLPNGQVLRPISQTPAPTRDLPDVPESPCIPDFLPSPSPPLNRRKITMGLIDDVTAPANTERFTPSSQSRQDRVKARKSRDMAALREKRVSRDAISDVRSAADTSRASSPGSRPSTSPQPRKRRSTSREQMRRSRNTISAIMLVADLAPHAGTGRIAAPAASAARKEASQPALMARGTYTPPRSSLSDSDMTPTAERSGFPAGFLAESAKPADQGLDSRRQERRVKRNMSLREKEMETRLRKVERDNAMLMTTLSGIAGSFGQLSSLLPQGRAGPEDVLAEEVLRPHGVVDEIQKLEPFMRELQAGAGRVSMEERVG
jgi:hypothetical protein